MPASVPGPLSEPPRWRHVDLHYLDIETTGLDPYRDEILTIQTRHIGPDRRPAGPLVVNKSWESDEATVVRRFLEETQFFTEPWAFVPVGFNLPYELKWLFVKGKRHGALPPTARFETIDKPRIDLKDLALLMNEGRFKGSKLENFSAKMGSGDIVVKAIAEKDYATIVHYIEQETEAFMALYAALAEEMPQVWRRIAPRLGVDADDPAPYRRSHRPLADAAKRLS